jgi:hypothetical protein
MKMRMGATHFLMKRLPKVASEMALHVLAYNITRAMSIMGGPTADGSNAGIAHPKSLSRLEIPNPSPQTFLHGHDPERTSDLADGVLGVECPLNCQSDNCDRKCAAENGTGENPSKISQIETASKTKDWEGGPFPSILKYR